jgi:hypothetical protein
MFTEKEMFLPITGGNGNPFDDASKASSDVTGKIQLAFVAIGILIVVISGVCYAVGGDDMKRKCKSRWGQIALACIVVFGAAGLLGFVKDNIADKYFKK